MVASVDAIDMPVVARLEDFDTQSGGRLERVIFNYRRLMIALCTLMTLFLGYHATQLKINASFEKMVPISHPYIKNFYDNLSSLSSLGNNIRIVVENTQGDIYDPQYLDVLQQINDKIYLVPGIDRAWVKSLWMPVVRWTEVTEEGYMGGPVMPDPFTGTPEQLKKLRDNIALAGITGDLVANNQKSSVIVMPLLAKIAETGQPLDYAYLFRYLDHDIRDAYESGQGITAAGKPLPPGKIKVHMVGFAKLAGDLIAGLLAVMGFFLVAAIIASVIIYRYTRCGRSTGLLVSAALLGVVWLLGLMQIMGFDLDPYSVLVPFLIFAIGLSHGAQKMNGIMQDIGRGTHKYVAARYTFRRLFLAGLTALLTNVVGFGVLMIIDIPVIRELAISTSVGVGVLIFTKLVLVPVMLSYIGVNPEAAKRSVTEAAVQDRGPAGRLWGSLVLFTEARYAKPIVIGSVVVGLAAFAVSFQLRIGDLDAGAPELRPGSRYNRDVAFVTDNYGRGSDVFAVLVKTPPGGCEKYETLVEADRLAWSLRQVPGVQSTVSLVDALRLINSANAEGSPKWMTIVRDPNVLGRGVAVAETNAPELVGSACSIFPVVAFLNDHKADTLARVLAASEQFAAEHNTADRQFLMVAGPSGIEAVTNIVVKKANTQILFILYGAVIILCFITFRSWRAVVVALVPLIITSMLCEALMVFLNIGVKVATLPAIALGVGVGVDYALYLVSIQLQRQRAGASLKDAYADALQFTGKVVALIGITLAAGVGTWVFSPIKFQADMGILLTFMFLWNMIGALILIPALSHFLLNKPEHLGLAIKSQGPAVTRLETEHTSAVSVTAASAQSQASVGDAMHEPLAARRA